MMRSQVKKFKLIWIEDYLSVVHEKRSKYMENKKFF